MKEPLRPAGRDPSLPDFLIVGMQKAGTTALMRNLEAHPQVAMAGQTGKATELHFFNKHWDKGLDWYRSFFCRPDCMQGEKTPDYIAFPTAIERMAEAVPHAKLIVTLRNPVDRAYSHWNHFNQIARESQAWGWVVEAFEQAIERKGNFLIHHGEYARHLSNLFRVFPREQVHIIISERLREHGDSEYRRLLQFLGLAPTSEPFRNYHEREYAEPMADATRARLERFFAPLNEELFALLGQRISEWPAPKAVPSPRRAAGGPLSLGFLTDRVADVSGDKPESSAIGRLAAAVARRGAEVRFASEGANVFAGRLAALLSSEDLDAVVVDIRNPQQVLAKVDFPADRVVVLVTDLADEAQWRPGVFAPGTHLAAASSHIATRLAAKTGLKPILLRPPRMGLPFTVPEPDEGALVLVVLQGPLPVALAAALQACPEIPFRAVAAEDVRDPEALAGARLAVFAGPCSGALASVAGELQRAGVPGIAARSGGAAEMLGTGGLLVAQAEQPAAWAEALRELWHNAARWEECSRAAMLHAAALQREEEEGSARLVSLLERARTSRVVTT